MVLAVYGKHPAKGDFLEHGIPAPLKPVLEGWLDTVLAQARADLGPAWEQVWHDAPVLRFWVGEAVWGQPVAGVMAASQDRVGRRFPLVVFCTGADAARVPAPTIGDDGGWYDALAAHLAGRLAQRDLAVPADLLTGAVVPGDLGVPEPGPDAFWAVRPGASVAALLADIALTDHRRAAAGRSYWWVAGQDAAPAVGSGPVAEAEVADIATSEPPPPVAAAEETVPDVSQDAGDAAPPVAEPDAWDLPDLPADDDSPFSSGGAGSGGGIGLFAAPLPADPAAWAEPAAAPVALPPAAPRVLASQVWAGSGLPSGPVLAWFLRGVSADG